MCPSPMCVSMCRCGCGCGCVGLVHPEGGHLPFKRIKGDNYEVRAHTYTHKITAHAAHEHRLSPTPSPCRGVCCGLASGCVLKCALCVCVCVCGVGPVPLSR